MSRKRANAGGAASQAKRARIEPPVVPAENTPADDSSLSSAGGSQPSTPPPSGPNAGSTAGKGLAGRTMVPTERGTVDETTVGAENLPLADVPSSPELPLAASSAPAIKREEDDTDTALLAGGTTIDTEEFKEDVRATARTH